MKVLIDFTQIPIQKTGAGIYAFNLIKEIENDYINNDFFVVIQKDEKCFDNYKNINIIKINSLIFRRFIFRFFLEQLYLPIISKRLKVNAIHSLHYSFPILSRRKCIVTIHDLTFFKFPELHIKFKRYYFQFFIKLAAEYAKSLICVSESTKNDLKELFPNSEDKTTVVPLGNKIEKFSKETITILKKKHGTILNQKYLLFIGTIEPRKNIKSLINAFYKILKEWPNIKLIICGKKGWYYNEVFNLVKMLGLSDSIVFTGYISEAEKHIFLSNAFIFIYPSIYEGFGIPVLEALSYGLPTITSNISSLLEVAGDAAILINPLSSNSIYLAIKKIFNDENLQNELKRKALKQANKFSWGKMLDSTMMVYKGINN